MFTINLDTSRVDARLVGMMNQLGGFPHDMAKEFTEWQSKDMRRRSPETTEDQTGVETIITPRGVSQAAAARRQQASRFARRVRRVAHQGSKRPILRPVLFEKLTKRMVDLMSSCLTWKGV